MTSCLLEKRDFRKVTRRVPKQAIDVDSFFIIEPRITKNVSLKPKDHRISVAKPTVCPTEIESNPIVRIQPMTGRHYRMVVVRRSAATFKPTSL